MDDSESKPKRARRGRDKRWGGIGTILRQNFGMFPGYPCLERHDRPVWRAFPDNQPLNSESQNSPIELEVTTDWLNQLQRSILKLRSQPEKALRAELKAPEAWLRRMEFLLSQLRGALNSTARWKTERWLQSDLIPQRRAKILNQFREQFPQAWRAAEALLWVCLTSHESLPYDLEDWLLQYALQFQTIVSAAGERNLASVRPAIYYLFEIRENLPADFVASLLDHLANLEAWQFSLNPNLNLHVIRSAFRESSPCNDSIKQYLNWGTREAQAHQTEGQVHSLGTILSDIPKRFARFTPAGQRSFAELLTALLSNQIPFQEAKQFKSWLNRVQEPSHRLSQSLDDENFGENFVSEAQLNYGREYFGIHELTDLLDSLSQDKMISAEEAKHWTKLYHALPSDTGIEKWRFISAPLKRFGGQGLIPELESLSEIFRKHRLPKSERIEIRDSMHLIGYSHGVVSEFLWFHRLFHETDVDSVYELFFEHGEAGPSVDFLETYCRVRTAFPTLDSCRKCIYETRSNARDAYKIRTVAKLTTETETFARVFENYSWDSAVLPAIGVIGESYSEWLPRNWALQLALDKQTRLLERWGNTIKVRRALKLPLPALNAIDSDRSWVQAYPEPFLASLLFLAQVRQDAEEIAASRLGQFLPQTDRLLEERSAIERRLADESDSYPKENLRHRLKQIERQLAGEYQVSEKEITKAVVKLEKQIACWGVERICAEACIGLIPEIERLSGFSPISPEILKGDLLALLAGILELAPGPKRVGLNILARRLAGLRTDVVSHPKNRAFLQVQRDHGLNLEPWLDQSIIVRGKAASGEDYFVSFADDVLDLFLMGQRFNTCLSPGEINFFSTITNISDANKRVAYGKTARGRVIGRRLLALTDDGHLMAFRPYSHDPADNFDEVSSRFASTLAEAMRAFITSRGDVSRLTLDSWYNDGAYYLQECRSLEAEDGVIGTILRQESPQEAVHGLIRAFGGKERLERQLQRVLELGLISRRIEIVKELAIQFTNDSASPTTRLTLALRCHVAGELGVARDLFNSLRRNECLAFLENHACLSCECFHSIECGFESVFEFLLAIDPPFALRLANQINRQEPSCGATYSTSPLPEEIRERIRATIWGGQR